ncbi:MAG: universal stress protein, partial [Acidimicrobiia bacterium]|nr:universal stress protein [Acidimicrobiia bacterium]
SFVRIEALRGGAAAAILGAVTANSVLCLGSRGRGGFAGMVLGSVSRACIESASCPVVIARVAASQQDAGGPVLVGMDGSEGSRLALDFGLSIGQLTSAPVAAVYAWEPTSSETRPRLHRRLHADAQKAISEWVGSRDAEPIEVEGDPRAALVALAEQRQAGMLVVGRRGTSRLRGITTGGVTSYLVSNSPTSVCVIPPASAAT